jgi:small-conductance mechanosensitive channel
LTEEVTGQIMRRPGSHTGVRMFKNKYVRIGIVVLLVSIIMFVLKGIGAAAFWAMVTGAILFFVSFDPRIKRHW